MIMHVIGEFLHQKNVVGEFGKGKVYGHIFTHLVNVDIYLHIIDNE